MIKMVVALGLAALLLAGCGSTVFTVMGCGASFHANASLYGNVKVVTAPCVTVPVPVLEEEI